MTEEVPVQISAKQAAVFLASVIAVSASVYGVARHFAEQEQKILFLEITLAKTEAMEAKNDSKNSARFQQLTLELAEIKKIITKQEIAINNINNSLQRLEK